MSTNENQTDVLNDLIEINNDRVAGFEKAIADIKDENIDLKSIFQGYAEQSRKNGQELAAIVGNTDNVETGTSVSGNLHRAWIDVKSIFGGSDSAGILLEAERGEDAIKRAYQDALNSSELPNDAAEIVRTQAQQINAIVRIQAQQINAAHDEIKTLRDSAKAN
jgi:uncharacterized protein (TIGR02284 family)